MVPLPEEDQICPVCGTQMVLLGEEYVRRELEFIPATCKVIEYYSQSYGCPSCKEGLGDTEKPCDRKVSGSASSAWKKDLHQHLQLHGLCTRSMPTGFHFTGRKRTGSSMGADQQDDPCNWINLLFKELFSANVLITFIGSC